MMTFLKGLAEIPGNEGTVEAQNMIILDTSALVDYFKGVERPVNSWITM